jgi:hypothetical protein
MSKFDDYLSASPAPSTAPSFDAYLNSTPAAAIVTTRPLPAKQSLSQEKLNDDAMWDRLGAFVYGGAKSAADVVQAPVQLVMNGASKILQSGVLGQPGPASKALIQKTNEYNQYLKDQEDQYQAETQGDKSFAAGLGRAVTGALPFVASGGTDAAAVAPGVVNSLKNAGSLAAKGGAIGALTSPVTNVTTNDDGSNNFFGQKAKQAAVSGAISGGLPLAYDSAKAISTGIYGAATPIINPKEYVGNQFAEALGDDAPNIAQNIKGAQQFVQGSYPTTAQVGQTPKLVATEKALANANPDFKIALASREAENNAARWQVLNSVAQTPDALTAADATRKAASAPLYASAHANTANVGPAFMRYAQIPEMQAAMERANRLASLDAAVGRGVQPVWPTPDSKTINGAALDYTSRALSDMIDEAQGKSQKTALSALKDQIDSWTQRYIPGVNQAAQTYAQHSVPINTMEAGQQIANTLGTRALDSSGLPQLQLNPYRTALVQALKSQKYGIDQDALTSLQGIGQDLQRSTVSNSLRSPGSDTAYNISSKGWLANQLYGPTFNGTGNASKLAAAGAALATGHPVIAGGVIAGGNKAAQYVGGRLNNALSDFLLNPSEFLPYLERGSTSSSRQKALADAVERYFVPFSGAVGSRVGLVNANN